MFSRTSQLSIKKLLAPRIIFREFDETKTQVSFLKTNLSKIPIIDPEIEGNSLKI
jgi:hypothetical protein